MRRTLLLRVVALGLAIIFAVVFSICASGMFPGSVPVVQAGSKNYNTARQLTEEDIQEMNDGQAIFVYSNSGYLSTLIGKYYEEPIPIRPDDIMITADAAINSLNGIASLIGLQKGSEFFANNAARDRQGYIYLSYQQRYGEKTVTNGTLHIVLDPEGYTAALSCSFTPSLGFAPEEEILDTQEILAYLKRAMPEVEVWYPEMTDEAIIWYNEQLQNCYVFFADNPNPEESFENLRYIKVYVARNGDFRIVLPSSSLTVSADTSYYPTEEYFEDLERTTWTGTVDLKRDGVKEVTIDVSYNPHDGLYYMTDPVRKIAVADCYDFFYQGGTLSFLTSSDNTWEERDVAAMYNYQTAYDVYADIGVPSPDGFCSPILLGRNYVDRNGRPQNNACYMGQFRGWFTFVYSEINDYCYDLDVVGHEYTHAVTNACILGDNYVNDAGAVNEAYSDIMGQLMEYIAGRTEDTEWLLAENSGETVRSMSVPEEFCQPSSIGGAYYVPNTDNPLYGYNDNGGVHRNSGILNNAAYNIFAAGMEHKDMFRLFYTALQILTPANTFEDVYAALIYSARVNGYGEYEDAITEAFHKNNVLNDEYTRYELESTVIAPDCGRMTFSADDADTVCVVVIYDALYGDLLMSTWPDVNGIVNLCLPDGRYYVMVYLTDLATGNTDAYVYTANGWEDPETSSGKVIRISNGRIKELAGLD